MVLKIWHRWACGYAPENTLKSFKKAIELWVDMIEFDIHVCKSWEIVVIHDWTVDRTTNWTGWIWELTLTELMELDAGEWEKIPLLQEVLNLVLPYCKVNIEIAGDHLVKPLVKFLNEYLSNHKCDINSIIVSSFRHHDLLKFHKKIPWIKISMLIWHLPYEKDYFKNKKWIYSVNLDSSFISKKFIKKSHKNWLKVFSYTANDYHTISHLQSIWIDGIFSNFPDRIKK